MLTEHLTAYGNLKKLADAAVAKAKNAEMHAGARNWMNSREKSLPSG